MIVKDGEWWLMMQSIIGGSTMVHNGSLMVDDG